jgi:hypothetical protein
MKIICQWTIKQGDKKYEDGKIMEFPDKLSESNIEAIEELFYQSAQQAIGVNKNIGQIK